MGHKASTICLHLDLSCLAACYASSHVRFISFNSGDIVHCHTFWVGLSLSSVVEFISVQPWRFAPCLFWGHAIAITFSRVLFPVPHCRSMRFSYRAVRWKFSQARRWSWLSWGRVCGRRWFPVTCRHSSALHTNHTAAPILHCSCMVRCWFLSCNASMQMEFSPDECALWREQPGHWLNQDLQVGKAESTEFLCHNDTALRVMV